MELAERLAEAVLRHELRDATVTRVKAQPRGEHDIDLLYGDGRTGVVEVASVANPLELSATKAILSPKDGGDTLDAVRSGGGWYVMPLVDASIRLLRQSLDGFLAELEAIGIRAFGPLGDELPEPLSRRRQALHLEFGEVVDFVPEGKILLGLPSGGGWVDARCVNEAVLEAALRPDNLRKLRSGTYSERHLFVFVHDSASEPHTGLFLSRGAAGPISLPPPITHAWVATFRDTLSKVIYWRMRRDGPWERHLVTLPLPVDLA